MMTMSAPKAIAHPTPSVGTQGYDSETDRRLLTTLGVPRKVLQVPAIATVPGSHCVFR